MMYRALASAIMASVLGGSKRQIIESTKASIAKAHLQKIQAEVLEEVAKQYTLELEHNVSEYIRSMEAAEVEVSFAGKPGEAFVKKAELAVGELERYLEAQNPDGEIIKYLKTRYADEGIGVVTGRLLAGHYVQRSGGGMFEVWNKMGYAAPVDKTRPWLTGSTTQRGLEEIIANAAREIFEIVFDGVDLSDEAALLNFAGEASKKLQQSRDFSLSDEELMTKTRDELMAMANTKRKISKKELIAKIRKQQNP